ncbi:MAG: glutathione S-transferase family protein [Alphaproteobacteria bacterium]|nr:glutathione S-transferase family protein [Alphaproteobacteria bacterium]
MIVYGASASPFVRKVLAYGAEKGLALELKNTGLGSQDPAFKEASPFGKMPGFRDGDFAISDSTAIITYLEALHPEPKLIPTEPKARARTVWYDEFADTIMVGAMGKIFFNRVVAPKVLKVPGDEAVALAAETKEVPPILDYIERILPESGWFVEDRLTLADISIASPFVNMMHVGLLPKADTHPKLAAFIEKMHARPSFAGWIEEEKRFFAR